MNAFENKLQVDSIYTDFSKAFDRVDHKLLVAKLAAWGFGSGILQWILSFLTGRVQRVRINNYVSKEIAVHSGVPQGSHSGPLFFILFINDIGKFITQSQFLLFADDLKIYRSIYSSEDCGRLQSDVDGLYSWSQMNGLDLNIKKCHSISFYRSHHPIECNYNIAGVVLDRVGDIRDLGVTLDRSLTFVNHINSITCTGYRNLGFVSRNCKEFSCQTFKLLYCSMVRSGLEYASVLWSPYYQVHVQAIEGVQKRFLRACAHKLQIRFHNFHIDYQLILNSINLCSLQDRRFLLDMCFLSKLITGVIDCDYLLSELYFNTRHNTRSRNLFCLPFHSTNYGMFRPLTRLQRDFDRHDFDVHTTHSKFKLDLKRKIRSNVLPL